jgi:hypothetical protein
VGGCGMRMNPQQKAAQEKLEEAVQQHVAAYRGDDDGVIADWILVTSTSGYDADGDGTSGYYMAYQGGEMSEHRAVGLLEWGKHMLTIGEIRGVAFGRDDE